MAVPLFLAGDYRYLATTGVTDVNTIISDLQTELPANGWTETSAGVFQSPADDFGRYVVLTVSRISATAIQFKVVDHAAVTIYDGSFYIDAAGTEVRYYTGPDYCFVESLRATAECGMLFKPNPDPETDTGVIPYPFYVWAFRTAAGAATGSTNYNAFYFMHPASYQLYTSVMSETVMASNVNTAEGLSKTGAYVFLPAEVFNRGAYWIGRIPQTLVCGASIAAGTQITMPIDTGINGVFQRLSARITAAGCHLMVRVG
jgi:hypothetical protein